MPPKKTTMNHAAGLVARMQDKPREVKRGLEYDLEVAIMMADHSKGNNTELVPVYRQEFTMLKLWRTNAATSTKAKSNNKACTETSLMSDLQLRMSFSGMKWAMLCKSYNFIHLSELAAKLLGLTRKLAHGNHVVAKAMQKLLVGKR
jgi:hypothetical protein